jgi:hypothetical protein
MSFSARGIHNHASFHGLFPYHAPHPQQYYQPPPQLHHQPSPMDHDQQDFYDRFDNRLATLEEGQQEI